MSKDPSTLEPIESAGLVEFEQETGETGCLISFYVSERDWDAYARTVNAATRNSTSTDLADHVHQFHALRAHIKAVGSGTGTV